MWEIFSSQMTKVSILRHFLGKNGDFWISTSCFNRPKMIAFSFGFFSHIETKILQQMILVASVARLYRATLKY